MSRYSAGRHHSAWSRGRERQSSLNVLGAVEAALGDLDVLPKAILLMSSVSFCSWRRIVVVHPQLTENINQVDAIDVGLGRDERGLGLAHILKFVVTELGGL